MNGATLLREQLVSDRVLRIAGAYDAVSAIAAERAGFDCLWAGGLAISTAHGVPDASILTMTEHLAATCLLERAVRIPVIADCDTGFGDVNMLDRVVHDYEAAGIAGICIEDKEFPKRNSFVDGNKLTDPHYFAAKLASVKRAQRRPEFVLLARVEALIAGAGMEEALRRGRMYAEAGADAILIHSKAHTPHEIFEFARQWDEVGMRQSLFVVPTTYPALKTVDVANTRVRGVIYANQALRAALRAAEIVFRAIIENGSSEAIEDEIATLREIFNLIGMDSIAEREARCNDDAARIRENEEDAISRIRSIVPDERETGSVNVVYAALQYSDSVAKQTPG
jgi:phosphoenolpyruvate phosphomutase